MTTNTQPITRGGLEFEYDGTEWNVCCGRQLIGWITTFTTPKYRCKLLISATCTSSDLRTIADFMDELNAQQTAGEAG